jgi:pimeloyl-ACP methyl ester carboxylesterase/DNA-binding winged helix-turn-helix (wHTH) protein
MQAGRIYEFDRFRLDADERILLDGDRVVQLAPKVFDTLEMLVENSGHALSKEEMMEKIWADSFVEENNLAQNISILRKALGTGGDGRAFIETVSKRGYRFIAPVETAKRDAITIEHIHTTLTVEEEVDDIDVETRALDRRSVSTQLALPTGGVPETHYVQNGDVNIAYQVVGSGDLDVVFVMGWVSHLEYFWAESHFAAFLNRLASFSRLILFDKRGTGLSDRVPLSELPTLEQRMEDVHAVMDAVGSKRAALIGVSEGGPMCSLFAATYPERTRALVMIGTYAKRILDDDYPWGVSPEDRNKFFETMQRDWGKPVGIEERAPSLADDENFRDWWATYLRMGASPGAAVALTKMNAEIDVRDVLRSVRVPTLVIHRSGDMCLKVEEGRYVASLIPNAKYLELGGVDHLPFVGEQEEILAPIEAFLTKIHQVGEEHDRVLATVLSVKIANGLDTSVRNAAAALIRKQIQIFKGREVPVQRNGVLAAFDGPARAIRCASAIASTAGTFKESLRIGLHTGECDVVGGTYGGFAVELAQKIALAAEPGNPLLSRTVKDLVAGSGLSFKEHGLSSFDGIEGDWRLFTLL